MTPRRLVIASKNPDKVQEIIDVLQGLRRPPRIVDGVAWPEVEESGETLRANAVLKARTVAAVAGLAAIADDTGLEVDALGGDPGVHTARFAGPEASYAENVAHLLRQLRGVPERSARFRTVIAVVAPGGEETVAEGVLEGRIADAPRGGYGFGYDPVFEVGGRTLGEMTPEEKKVISHRALALRSLAELWSDT